MMRSEQMERVLNVLGSISFAGVHWCLCFGSLLSVVRNKALDLGQDIDIGIIGGGREAFDYLRGTMSMGSCVLSDATGAPIEASFALPGDHVLDVYWWLRRDGNAYHCFDEQMERPRNGVLRSYHFKGVPAGVFWPSKVDVAQVPPACFNKRLIHGIDPAIVPFGSQDQGDWTYQLPVPGYEADGHAFRLPFGYGAALDYWYPGCWVVPDGQYGTSKCSHEFTVATCKGVC